MASWLWFFSIYLCLLCSKYEKNCFVLKLDNSDQISVFIFLDFEPSTSGTTSRRMNHLVMEAVTRDWTIFIVQIAENQIVGAVILTIGFYIPWRDVIDFTFPAHSTLLERSWSDFLAEIRAEIKSLNKIMIRRQLW